MEEVIANAFGPNQILRCQIPACRVLFPQPSSYPECSASWQTNSRCILLQHRSIQQVLCMRLKVYGNAEKMSRRATGLKLATSHIVPTTGLPVVARTVLKRSAGLSSDMFKSFSWFAMLVFRSVSPAG